jgi:hypothetical protein
VIHPGIDAIRLLGVTSQALFSLLQFSHEKGDPDECVTSPDIPRDFRHRLS